MKSVLMSIISTFFMQTAPHASACITPAQFFSVVHPHIVPMLAHKFKLTVGDILALKPRMQVVGGAEHLTPMAMINGEAYFLVASDGELQITVDDDKGPFALQIQKPTIDRGMHCADSRPTQ